MSLKLRFIRLLALAIGSTLFLSSLQSRASLFSAEPWCESRFSKTPREIKAFHEDMKYARQIKIRDSYDMEWRVNDTYGKQFVAILDRVFENNRYKNLTPEVRSRLISYVLVKLVRLPKPRQIVVYPLSEWLLKQLNEVQGFSVKDLERIRLSYNIFLARRSPLRDRNNAFWEVVPAALADGGGSWLLDAKFAAIMTTVSAALFPGAEIAFLPIPFFTLTRMGWALYAKTIGDPLNEGSLKLISQVDRKLLDLIGGNISPKDLQARWTKNLKGALTKTGTELLVPKTGSEAPEGMLLQLVNEFCLMSGAVYEKNAAEGVQILAYMAQSYETVNPLEWSRILESFTKIRVTARELGISEIQAAPIFQAMRNVAAKWESNAQARAAVENLLKASFTPQALPEQAPTGTAGETPTTPPSN